ncbi:MAG: Phenylalanine-tRNA ligase alpha subunit [Candidatus Moranbacteria bacterium GW2011_GWE2_35_164]|nr:MAG: Phenylalanine-tRNA ligase alpha subunit [Candidatus Moranbacteria bacterium GW2011_GWE2_35_164]
MLEKIKKIKDKAIEGINKAKSAEELETLRIDYLGKKSEFNQILKGLKDLSDEEKKMVGPLANESKTEIQTALENKMGELEDLIDMEKEWIDVTAPGKKIKKGHYHPLSIVQKGSRE